MGATWTFNPGFYSDDELIARFCVRAESLEALISTSRAKTDTNQHTLVIGPRGFGKTMLLRRFATALRRDPELEGRWFPIVFAEESYPVSSAGELWLEALTHLADATGSARWQKAYIELRRERDEPRLRARALAQLLDFADERGRGLVLIVENVDKLLGDLPEADGWALRETLLHERRIQLVAAAPRGFEGVEKPNQPFYELFRRILLDPLTDAEIAALWRGTNGEDLPAGRAIALRILTGGNPRLVVLLATVAKGLQLRDLISELAGLIDQHTNYFNANIEAITSPEMRRTFLALAELWAPATARQIGEATRADVSKASMLLGRLVDQGRVEVVRDGKTKTYQITERLYNIYYLMRRHGVHQVRLGYLVDFMAMFLEPRPDILARFAGEACDEDGERVLVAALVDRVVKTAEPEVIADFLKRVPSTYLAKHAPKGLKRKMKTPESLIALLGREDAGNWVGEACTAALKLEWAGRTNDAVSLVRSTVPRLPTGVSKERDICGLILRLAGEKSESNLVCPPRADGLDQLAFSWFLDAMSEGRVADALPLLAEFERLWPEASHFDPKGADVGWAWICQCAVVAGEWQRALSVASAHPSGYTFRAIFRASSGVDAKREVATAWVKALPEDGDGWFYKYFSTADLAARQESLARAIRLGCTWAPIAALSLESHRGDFAAALDSLRAAAEAPHFENSDNNLLTPALLLLARQVPAADLVAALRGTPAAARLEPIYVALQRRAGEEPNAPREVLELADIVDQRIDEVQPPARSTRQAANALAPTMIAQ